MRGFKLIIQILPKCENWVKNKKYPPMSTEAMAFILHLKYEATNHLGELNGLLYNLDCMQ